MPKLRIKKAAPFSELRAEAAAKLGLDPASLRFTRFATRHMTDKHQRPTQPIAAEDEGQSACLLSVWVPVTPV
jgi:hypothetical protein